MVVPGGGDLRDRKGLQAPGVLVVVEEAHRAFLPRIAATKPSVRRHLYRDRKGGNVDVKTLRLTTPPMRGPDVRSAQKLLADQNNISKFGNFKPGKLDGIYGQDTAAACRRARFWLGYSEKDATFAIFNQQLADYLLGKDPLPLAYQKRRKSRLAVAADANAARRLREAAFTRAVGQVGVKEKPANSNRVKFTEWYGVVGPWCAMFVTWCYVQAGSKATFKKGTRYAYVPYMNLDAASGRNGLRKIDKREVSKGDLVTFQFDQDANPDHVGLFHEWINKNAGTFRTIEGNTSVTSNDNGGEVMRRERNMGLVSMFIRAEA